MPGRGRVVDHLDQAGDAAVNERAVADDADDPASLGGRQDFEACRIDNSGSWDSAAGDYNANYGGLVGDCDGNVAMGGHCETNVTNNVNNCGGCGIVCSFANAGAACQSSSCGPHSGHALGCA